MIRTPGVTSGNAADDRAHAGWFVGHFIPPEAGPRSTTGVEVKWSVYEGHEERDGWGANREAMTLAVLVRGRFRLSFPGREVLLTREGDFALWEPGVPHFWRPEGPTIILTVRWPSLPGDSMSVPPPSAEPAKNPG